MKLSRFRNELRRFERLLPSATYWRYQTGKVGPFGRMLIRNPELAIAFAEDVQEYHQDLQRELEQENATKLD